MCGPRECQIVKRKEVAARMSRSVRLVDKLAEQGLLEKVRLPGRERAIGFRAEEVEDLLRCRSARGRCS